MTLKQHSSLLRTKEGRDLFRLAVSKVRGSELEEFIIDKYRDPDKKREEAFDDYWENSNAEKIKAGLLVFFEASNSQTL